MQRIESVGTKRQIDEAVRRVDGEHSAAIDAARWERFKERLRSGDVPTQRERDEHTRRAIEQLKVARPELFVACARAT